MDPDDSHFPEDPRVVQGKKLAELLWWSLAKRIMSLAGEEYEWNDEQWAVASQIFLRPNDYFVRVGD
jgi:hypothetical protein